MNFIFPRTRRDIVFSANNQTRVFVTSPRFLPGVPATLGFIKNGDDLNGNPLIQPYPSLSWHQNPKSCNQNRLISVYRIQIDECGRLWVLDDGRFIDEIVCKPQILAFDLKTDTLLMRFEFPEALYEPRSILVTPIVETSGGNCENTFVYMADCQAYSLIVLDAKKGEFWRIIDKTFYPYPNWGTYDILGTKFELMDGILGMALSPKNDLDKRKLFYHALSSTTENWVYTKDLKNKTRFENDPSSSPGIFHVLKGFRSSQSAGEAIDKNGVAFFGLAHETSVNCWDTRSGFYGGRNIGVVERNTTTLQFPSGVKVITGPSGGEDLWVVTMSLQKVFTGTLDLSDENFRILRGAVGDLVKKCRCSHRKG